MAGLSASGGGAAAVRAGRAYVEMFLKDVALQRAFGRLKEKFNALGSMLTRAGAVVGGAGASVTAAFAPALDALGEQSKIADAADAFGLTGESASRLFGIMAAGGSDIRDTTEGLVTLNQRVSDAIAGTGEESANLFKGLGVAAQDFEGLDSAGRFYKLFDSLRAVADPAQRVQLLLKAVGEDTGKNLIPLLSMSADEMRGLGEAFGSTTEDLQAAREATRAQTLATAGLKKIWAEIATSIAPVVKDFADRVKWNVAPIAEWVRNNRELVSTVLRVAGGAAAGAAFVALGLGAGAVASAIGGFGAIATTAVGAVALLVKGGVALAGAVASVGLPVLAGVAAVAALAAGLGYLFAQTETGQQFFGALREKFGAAASYIGDAFRELLGTATEAWGGITAAVGKGDLALAGEIAVTALELLWVQAVDRIMTPWRALKTWFVETWHEVTDGLGAPLAAAWEDVVAVFEFVRAKAVGIWDQIVAGASGVADKVRQAWDRLSEGTKAVLTGLATVFAPILGPIVLVVKTIEDAWGSASTNMMDNVVKVGHWFERTFVRVKGAVVNAFNAMAKAALDFGINSLEAARWIDRPARPGTARRPCAPSAPAWTRPCP